MEGVAAGIFDEFERSDVLLNNATAVCFLSSRAATYVTGHTLGFPIGARGGEVGRPRVESQVRRIMLETIQRAARVIPRRDNNDAPGAELAENPLPVVRMRRDIDIEKRFQIEVAFLSIGVMAIEAVVSDDALPWLRQRSAGQT